MIDNATSQQPIVYVIDDDPSMRAALEDLLELIPLRFASFELVQDFLASERDDAPARVSRETAKPPLLVLDELL